MTQHVQVAIVGGGLAGRAAAYAAAKAGFVTCHFAPRMPRDRRTSAIMMPGIEFISKLGLLPDPASVGVPLSQIRIIDATNRFMRAPETLFEAKEFDLEQFGWNLPNAELLECFEEQTQTQAKPQSQAKAQPLLTTIEQLVVKMERYGAQWHLTLADGDIISCDLLVGADGKASRTREALGIKTREHHYDQAALVCDLELERPIDGCSVEFHYRDGPFTLVPAGGKKANLVWIDKREILEAARNDPHFIEIIAQKSQRLFGVITPVTPTHVFPLSKLSVDVGGQNGGLLIGEAAHAFPPIGAQGLNLGFRDVEDFYESLMVANPKSYDWADAVVERYTKSRAADLINTGLFVGTLFQTLISEFIPAQAMRTAGLWTLRTMPALRKKAIKFGMGS